MVEPIWWPSMRGSLHNRTVFPIMPDVGMQVTLQKNLAKRLQPKEIIDLNEDAIDMARRILHRKRVDMRLISGNRLNLKDSHARETLERLDVQPFRNHTNLDGFYRESSNTYSDRSTAMTFFSTYRQGRETLTRDSTFIHFERDTPRTLCCASSSLCDTSMSHDPEKQPNSRGYLVKLKKPIVYKKTYTEIEIQNIVKRLTDYHSGSYPAGSKEDVRETPSVITKIPRQSMVKIKKCTAEEVQEIVTRLYKLDKSKWPPESKDRIYSGRPKIAKSVPTVLHRQILTASAPPKLASTDEVNESTD